jgi:hypothetical protein
MRVIPATLLSALGALLIAFAGLPASAAATSTQGEIDSAIAKALAFATAQGDAATGEPPEYDRTSLYSGEWLASGYAAAGLSAADLGSAPDPSLQDFLFGELAGFWDDPSVLAPEYTDRLILVADAAGIDTARISPTQNLPAELAATWKPAAGGFGEPNTFSTAWGVLALRTTPLPVWALAPPLAYLRADQHPDGGWSFYSRATGEESSPDITAAAVGALCAAGVPAYDPAVSDGLAYLHALQVKATGAIFNPEFGENIDTSSWTVNALNACGIDPQSSAWTTADGKTPIDHILSLQLAEGGFAWVAGEPWFPPSTGHALRALAGYGFAVGPAPRQDPAQPTVRPVPAVAAGTPVPHLLAIELAPGNVRLCEVTAPVGASLTEVLAAARGDSLPAGCVTSLSTAGGEIEAIDGFAPEGTGEAWLVRLDRDAAAVAGQQSVGFGDVISLRRGPVPPADPGGDPDDQAGASADQTSASTAPPAQPGAAGQPGPGGRPGKRGARGMRGKPGRNASIVCRVRHRRSGKPKVRCTVGHKGARAARGGARRLG